MSKGSFFSHVVPCAIAATLTSSVSATAWSEENKPTAADLEAKGRLAIEAARPADAAKAWKEAWALEPGRPGRACNIGRAALLVGDVIESYVWTNRCVLISPLPTNPAEMEVQRQRNIDLAIARSRVALLAVDADEGALVSLDDTDVGVAPLDEPLVALPGKHQVEARKGATSMKTVVDAKASREHHISLHFGGYTKIVSETSPSTSTDTEDMYVMYRPRWTPILVGLGLTVATTMVGVGFKVHADDLSKDYQLLDVQRAASGTSCPYGATTPICQDLSAIDDRRSLYGGTSTGLFIAGATLGLATIVFTIWEMGNVNLSVTRGNKTVDMSGLQVSGKW